MTCTDGEADPDENGERSAVVRYFRRGLAWLRGLHRGFAYSGHLPRRRK